MAIIAKILSAKFGILGVPSLIGINVPKGSGAVSPVVGIVSGEADQVISEGVFPVMLIPTGIGNTPGQSSGEFSSPIRRVVNGRGRNLGDSWSDWFRNYTG